MADPIAIEDIDKILPKWAKGQVTLKEIKGYTDDELYAIAHTGYFFLMQGKNDEARTLFEGLVAIDPRNAYYYRALGVIFHKLGDEKRALKQFGYAIKVHPRGAASYVNRAEVHISQQRYREANQDLQRAAQCLTKKEVALRRKCRALAKVCRRAS